MMRRTLALAAVLASLAVGVSGCLFENGSGVAAPQVSQPPFPNSGDGVTPQLGLGARSRPHVPLSVGDRWEYAIHMRLRIDDGSSPAHLETFERQGLREIGSLQDREAVPYALQRSHGLDPRTNFPDELAPLRTGQAGVFYLEPRFLDPATPLPPDPPAPGALPGEQAALRFPLGLGAHWRAGYPFPGLATVAGLDRVRVPAGVFIAWRVELATGSTDPAEKHTYWYSDAGVVRESHRMNGGQVEWVTELSKLQLVPADQP